MAGLIRWSDAFLVGVDIIDEQHQKLIEIINDLHGAMRKGRGKYIINKTYGDLFEYTKYHFNTENGLMLINDLHGNAILKHRSEHDNFTKTSEDLQNELQSGNTNITIPTMFFLRDWWTHHILETDKEFGKMLNKIGVT